MKFSVRLRRESTSTESRLAVSLMSAVFRAQRLLVTRRARLLPVAFHFAWLPFTLGLTKPSVSNGCWLGRSRLYSSCPCDVSSSRRTLSTLDPCGFQRRLRWHTHTQTALGDQPQARGNLLIHLEEVTAAFINSPTEKFLSVPVLGPLKLRTEHSYCTYVFESVEASTLFPIALLNPFLWCSPNSVHIQYKAAVCLFWLAHPWIEPTSIVCPSSSVRAQGRSLSRALRDL